MTETAITSGLFPSLKHGVHGKWVPILLAPISGSQERLVIGVVAANGDGFAVKMADRLERLDCLYGAKADVLKMAIEVAEKHFLADFANRGFDALENPLQPLESLSFGTIRNGEGESLEEIAQSWLRATSSLCSRMERQILGDVMPPDMTDQKGSDRLPFLVLEDVSQRELRLSDFFRPDIKEGRQRRRRNADIEIDFSGRRLVANFATLRTRTIGPSVQSIKTRLWDLKVDRDREYDRSFPSERVHELILQVPAPNDPQVSEKQEKYLRSAYEELEAQAGEEELRLRAFNSIRSIGQHVITAEAVQ